MHDESIMLYKALVSKFRICMRIFINMILQQAKKISFGTKW